MDISNFDRTTIDTLSYCVAYSKITVNANLSTDGRNSWVRKRVMKFLNSSKDLDPHVKAELKKCDNDEFFDTILACNQLVHQEYEDRKAAFSAQHPEFSDLTNEALFEATESAYDISVVEKGDNIRLFLWIMDNHVQLTLKNARIVYGEDGFRSEKISNLSNIEKSDDGYTLIFNTLYLENADYELDEIPHHDCGVFCTDITSEMVTVQIDPVDYPTPWQYLADACSRLIRRSKKVELTADEKAILPMAEEIASLFSDSELRTLNSFPILKDTACSLGYFKVCKTIEKIENADFTARRKLTNSLYAMLLRSECEPFWRAFYEPIGAVFKTYPTFNDLTQPLKSTKVEEVKAQIEEMMHEKGYLGKYPDFSRKAYISGVHIIGDILTGGVSIGKDLAEFYIHFGDFFAHSYEADDEELNITFDCGTRIVKKDRHKKKDGERETDECTGDILSCFFISERTCHNDEFSLTLDGHDWEEDLSKLRRTIDIAVKKAELKRLTKDEKVSIGEENTFFGSFAALSVMGIFFVPILVLIMIAVAFIILVPFVGFDFTREIFADVPFWTLLLISYSAYEVMMLIFMALRG